MTFWCDPRGPPSLPEPNDSSGSHSILYFVMDQPPSAGGAFHKTLQMFGVCNARTWGRGGFWHVMAKIMLMTSLNIGAAIFYFCGNSRQPISPQRRERAVFFRVMLRVCNVLFASKRVSYSITQSM